MRELPSFAKTGSHNKYVNTVNRIIIEKKHKAREANKPTYEGRPCKYCGGTTRDVKRSDCVKCTKERWLRGEKRKEIGRKRKKLFDQGIIKYESGIPCKYGHRGLRYTNGGSCVECEEMKHKNRKDNPEKYSKLLSAKKKYRKKPESKRKARNLQLLKNYGITVEEQEKMYKEQNGICANPLCDTRFPSLNERLKKSIGGCMQTDHDHDTGKIRGLLCNVCNMNLGNVEKLMKLMIGLNIKLPITFNNLDRGLYLYLEQHTESLNERNRRVRLCLHM